MKMKDSIKKSYQPITKDKIYSEKKGKMSVTCDG